MVRIVRVLVVMGMGGHGAEMARLVGAMGPTFDYHYVIAEEDGRTAGRIPVEGPVHRVTNASPPGTSPPGRLARTLRALCQSVRLAARVRPDAVLLNGPGMALPVALACRAVGARIVVVESMARAETLSRTARLLRPFASRLWVQWPSLQANVPGSRFAGRVF